jgi:hypothetical protein
MAAKFFEANLRDLIGFQALLVSLLLNSEPPERLHGLYRVVKRAPKG